MRKATAFRGGANKTAPPCETLVVNNPLQLFRGNSCNEILLYRKSLLLGKTIFSVRQKGVPPLLLPASVLQLPRCLVRICNFDSYCFTLFELHSFKKCNCSRENLLQNSLLRKCGLLAHTSAAFLKNCCTEKLFVCLRLVFCTLFKTKSVR